MPKYEVVLKLESQAIKLEAADEAEAITKAAKMLKLEKRDFDWWSIKVEVNDYAWIDGPFDDEAKKNG